MLTTHSSPRFSFFLCTNLSFSPPQYSGPIPLSLAPLERSKCTEEGLVITSKKEKYLTLEKRKVNHKAKGEGKVMAISAHTKGALMGTSVWRESEERKKACDFPVTVTMNMACIRKRKKSIRGEKEERQ